MKQEFTLAVAADNSFSILNRIVNVLNRRRVRIKKLFAREDEDDFRRGDAILLLHTTADVIEKIKHHLEKLVEVEYANYYEGEGMFIELTENRQNSLSKNKKAISA
jgi:acetolactate synthase small subunit